MRRITTPVWASESKRFNSKGPRSTDAVTTTLAGRNVAQHTAKKKWGHVIPSGGEDRGRLVLREADPLSKYLMSFRTVGLFQSLPLQNNSHYTPGRVITYACVDPEGTSKIIYSKGGFNLLYARVTEVGAKPHTLTSLVFFERWWKKSLNRNIKWSNSDLSKVSSLEATNTFLIIFYPFLTKRAFGILLKTIFYCSIVSSVPTHFLQYQD